jgi:alcohol dehydrogenase
VQIGLLPSVNGDPAIPMERVIAYELTILGSHGMAAHDYPELLRLIASGTAQPEQLITRTIALDEASAALAAMDTTPAGGVTVIEPWR